MTFVGYTVDLSLDKYLNVIRKDGDAFGPYEDKFIDEIKKNAEGIYAVAIPNAEPKRAQESTCGRRVDAPERPKPCGRALSRVGAPRHHSRQRL